MFDIPNSPDTNNFNQAEPDAGDFHALGERSTGVVSGCAVTSQGAPSMAVDLATGSVVVNNALVPVTATSVAVQTSESNPRFDLVVADNSGAVSVLKGAASSNPRYPAFDPTVYCLLASLYIRAGASTIVATDVIDKRLGMETSFQRAYADDTETALKLTDTAHAKTTAIGSDGTLSWMSNVLKRTADAAMEFATSLVMKAADTSLPLITLKGRPTTPEGQQVLRVEPASATTALASISGTGVASFANLQNGSGSPQGSLVAPTGTMYVDTAAGTLWIKTTSTGNTGWTSLLGDSGGQVLPTGTLVPSMDPAVITTPPTGFLYCNGATFSGSANPALAAKFPSLRVPDMRGRLPFGAGGTGASALALGAAAGAITKTLSTTEMPAHAHTVHDPKHVHPVQGTPYYNDRLSTTGSTLRPDISSNPNIPTMDVNLIYWDASASTGITINPTGGGAAFSLLNPVMGVHWLIKT